MSQAGSFGSGGSGGGGITNLIGDFGSASGTNVTVFSHLSTVNAGKTVFFNNTGSTSTFNVTDANNNTIIGRQAGLNLGSSHFNVGLGDGVLAFFTSTAGVSGGNTVVGSGALGSLVNGLDNSVFGGSSGSQYTSNESNNILINNDGVTGESNVLRIGRQGSGASQVNKCFIAGIVGNTVSNQQIVTIDSSSGQMGVTSSSGPASYFSAYQSAPTGNVTGDGTLYGPVVFDGVLNNVGSAYNPATGVFTAPATGMYNLSHTIAFVGGDSNTSSYITVWSGSAYSDRAFQMAPAAQAGANTTILSANINIPMTAGDTMAISVLAAGSSLNMAVYGGFPSSLAVTSTFSGFQIA